jgi:septal ring factor EnvC (AmiA/AmiB activator)
VYAGLGETRVKEGQLVSTLDVLGTTAETGTFYFELRHNEQPVNPLAYLSSVSSSELSSRRTFR